MTDYVAVLHNMALNQRKRDAESGLANPLINTARLLAGAAEHMKRLEAENAVLRRERDDALRAAWAVRDLATPPVSDEDVERAVAEAKRVRQEIEGERT